MAEVEEQVGRRLEHLDSKQATVASARATVVFNPVGGPPWHGRQVRITGGGTCTISIDGATLEGFAVGVNARRALPNVPIWHELRLAFVGIPSTITTVTADLWGNR